MFTLLAHVRRTAATIARRYETAVARMWWAAPEHHALGGLMRATLAMIAAVLMLAGCSSSTLPEDDQTFCAEQEEDPLAYLRTEVDGLIGGDRHWSSDGEFPAFQQVTVKRSQDFLDAARLQDQDLVNHVQNLKDALFDLQVGVDEESVFADDARLLRKTQENLSELQEFCDAEG